MNIAPHLLQTSIPAEPKDPAWPFELFGWPAVLCGTIGSYHYPVHTGPLSVNFCFGGVFSAREGSSEWVADSSSFCIAARRQPTTIQMLTSRTADQLAFFYTPSSIASLLGGSSSQSGEEGNDQDFSGFSLLRNGTYPLEGSLRSLVKRCRRQLLSPSLTDELVEEMHAGFFGALAEWLHPALFQRWRKADASNSNEARLAHQMDLSKHRIDMDPITPKSLEERAQEAGLSRFHYLRQFKKHHQTTPGQYALLRKMELAKLMLAAGELHVEDICHILRYQSASHFSLVFKETTGVSPKAYQLLHFSPFFRQEARRKIAQMPLLRGLA